MTTAPRLSTLRSRLVLAGATAATFLAMGVNPSAGNAAPKRFYGVSPQTGLTAADYARMDGRVGTLRIAIFWSEVDRAPPVGNYDFTAIDAVVAQAASSGVTALPFLYGTPNWVATELDGRGCDISCPKFAPTSGRALAAWRDFVAATVARYGRGGSFWAENPTLPQRPMKAFQIWNEQNSRTFFAPKAKPRVYAKLLRAAASAIEGEDRAAKVVLGGMAQLAGSRKAKPASRYLAELYRIKGIEKHFDGVATHPYGARLRKITAQVRRMSAQIKRARDRRASLWVTEIGAGSAPRGNPLNRGKKGQAHLLAQAYEYFERERRRRDIKLVVWFSWRDTRPSICDWCASSGLFSAAGKPKPAWRAFTRASRR